MFCHQLCKSFVANTIMFRHPILELCHMIKVLMYNDTSIRNILTWTYTGPLVRARAVIAPQTFPRVTRIELGANLSHLSCTDQTARAVVENQRHSARTHWWLLGTTTSRWAYLRPCQDGQCHLKIHIHKMYCIRYNNTLTFILIVPQK